MLIIVMINTTTKLVVKILVFFQQFPSSEATAMPDGTAKAEQVLPSISL